MSNNPHTHTVEEVKANIARIEHNSSSGQPSMGDGGSAANRNSGTVANVNNSSKGDDYAGKRTL